MSEIVEVVKGDKIMSLAPHDGNSDKAYRLYFHCAKITESDRSDMKYKGLVGFDKSELWVYFSDADMVIIRQEKD